MGVNSKLDIIDGRINELEYWSEEITQSIAERKKEIENMKENARNADTISELNLCLIGVQDNEGRVNSVENTEVDLKYTHFL